MGAEFRCSNGLSHVPAGSNIDIAIASDIDVEIDADTNVDEAIFAMKNKKSRGDPVGPHGFPYFA